MSEINTPTLRFWEFDGEWKILELGELIARSSKKVNPKIDDKDYNCIELEHISQNTGRLLGFISSKNQESIKNYFDKNQVLFGKLRPYLKKYLRTTFDGVCSSEIWVLYGEKITNDYLFQLVQTSKFNEIANISSGSKMPRSDWKYMSLIPFFYPTKPEQQKIATFLSAIDSSIEQLSKKEQLLRTYKKGVMQKIFSREIRFKRDDGGVFEDWKTKFGNEIFKNVSNKNHDSDLPILAVTQEHGAIPRDMIEYKMLVTEKSISSYKVIDIGDFIISLRSFQGGIEYSKYKGICSPAYVILKPIIEIEKDFFKNYFKTHNYIQELNKKLEGIRDGKMISFKYFSEIKLPYPSLPEQTKIANFLSSLDKQIAQVSEQLVEKKDFKKGLLQKMFV